MRWTPAIIACALAPGSALAEGLYITGGAALSVYRDAEGDARSGATTVDGEVLFNNGFAARGAVGWDFGDFKLEAEGAYQRYTIDKVIATGSNNSGAISEFDTAIGLVTGGVNAYYAPRFDRFRPFAGVGLGWTPIVLDDIEFTVDGVTTRVNDPDTTGVFTVSSIVGLDYALTDRFSIGGEYRYVASTKAEIEDPQTGDRIELERAAHEFGMRATYALWSPSGFGGERRRHADAAKDFAPHRTSPAGGAAPSFAPAFEDGAQAPAAGGPAFVAEPTPGGDFAFQPPATSPAPARTPARTASTPSGAVAIQTGAFRDPANAARRLAMLQSAGFNGAFVAPKGGLQAVYAGGYPSRAAAASDLSRAKAVAGDAFVTARP